MSQVSFNQRIRSRHLSIYLYHTGKKTTATKNWHLSFLRTFPLILGWFWQITSVFLPICVVYGSLPTATSCEDADFYTTYTLNIDDFFLFFRRLASWPGIQFFCNRSIATHVDWRLVKLHNFYGYGKTSNRKKNCAKKIVWIYVKDTMLLSDIIRGATDDL